MFCRCIEWLRRSSQLPNLSIRRCRSAKRGKGELSSYTEKVALKKYAHRMIIIDSCKDLYKNTIFWCGESLSASELQ
jgi:hypothetical protein